MVLDFSITKRVRSFKHAGRGVWVLIRSTHNLWVQLFVLVLVVGAGLYFGISRMEWLVIVLAGGMVIVAEAFNTALEIDIDLVSPQYHELARNVKDVAAGAVLLACTTAVIAGAFIFLPYIF